MANSVDPHVVAQYEQPHLGLHSLQIKLQSNFNGSNTFGTMQIGSRQGKFEPMRVDYSARSVGLIGISF